MVGPIGPGVHVYGDGTLNDYGVDFYTNFARGGFSSCCIPYEFPKDGGHLGTLCLDEEHFGFMNMHFTQRCIHAFGCVSTCEIYHAGCCMLPKPDRDLMSASAFVYNGYPVREMNEEDMEDVIQQYIEAAVLAKRSGFDCLMLHYGHGWLMNNFLDPLINKRRDSYGGSVENRCRFPRTVVERIRGAIGDDMAIEIRMNGWDYAEGGITFDDAAQQALIFQDVADMIHVTCGTRLNANERPRMHPTCFVPDAHNWPASEALKKAGVTIPVGIIGSVHHPELAERLLAEGKADYILMARQAVADPDIVNKIRQGREEDIRPCIRCDYCLDGGRRSALTTQVTIRNDATFDRRCSVNPVYSQGAARVKRFRFEGTKNVAVIGGGVAGMQAALSASAKGHTVVLFEKGNELGGQTTFYPQHLWFKKEVLAFREYLRVQIAKSNVSVRLNTLATPDDIASANFDAVIVAVGAVQSVPPIKGLDQPHVHMAWSVFGNEATLGQRVVVVGGGSVGCELAISLAEKGRQVSVVEMAPFIAPTSQISERMSIVEFLQQNHVNCHIETRCTGIDAQAVHAVDKEGKPLVLAADAVIIAAGSVPLIQERDAFADVALDVINVGDCTQPGTILHAVDSGWCAGNVI